MVMGSCVSRFGLIVVPGNSEALSEAQQPHPHLQLYGEYRQESWEGVCRDRFR